MSLSLSLSLVEYPFSSPPPFLQKDQPRLHQFGKKVLPGIFFGYVLYAGGIWNGDVMVASSEELDKMSRIVTIGLGRKMVGWFNGMRLLSANCPRPPGRRENSLRKTIRRTIEGSSDTFRGKWLNIIRFLQESSQCFTNFG